MNLCANYDCLKLISDKHFVCRSCLMKLPPKMRRSLMASTPSYRVNNRDGILRRIRQALEVQNGDRSRTA